MSEFDEVAKLTGGPVGHVDDVAPHLVVPTGTMLTVTWGEEVLQPIQFNGFRVGPITVSLPVLPGETLQEAHARIWAMLDVLGRNQYNAKLEGWKGRLRESAASVRER